MFKLLNVRTTFWISAVLMAAGCSSPKQAVYDHEHFDDAGTFSRSYPATDMAYCEAGRRALLSQGYIITSSDPKMIAGRKSFQQTGDTHIEISFNLVCAADAKDGNSTMFANALQDRYALKKTNNSASLGVGVLGSVSMPIGSTDDSMVKVASETVSSAKFYERFFGLVENFLPPEVKKAAHIVEKPKADLGVPDTAPQPRRLPPRLPSLRSWRLRRQKTRRRPSTLPNRSRLLQANLCLRRPNLLHSRQKRSKHRPQNLQKAPLPRQSSPPQRSKVCRGASVTAFPRWSVRNNSRQSDHHRAHAPRGYAGLDALRPLVTRSVRNERYPRPQPRNSLYAGFSLSSQYR